MSKSFTFEEALGQQPSTFSFEEVLGTNVKQEAAAPAPRTTSGLDLSMVPEQFGAGVAGMQKSFYMTGAKRAAENLQILDRIDKGEAVPEAQDPLGYQQMNPTQRAAARAELESYFPKNVAKAVAYGQKEQQYAKNPLAEQFVKAGNEGGAGAAWNVFKKDPLGIIQQFSVQSAPNMLPGLVGGAAGLLLRGGLPAMMTGLASGSFPVEYMASIVESLQDAKVDLKDTKAVEAKLRDPKFLEAAGKQAVTRGTVIASAEAATGRLAAPITRGAGLGKNLRAAGRNLLVEPGMEGLGEAAAQQAAGQEFKLGDVLAEIAGAGPQVATTTALRTAAAQRPTEKQRAAGQPPPVAERVEPTLNLDKAIAPSPDARIEPTIKPATALLKPEPARADLDVEAEVARLTANLPISDDEARSIVAGRQRREQQKVDTLAGVTPPVFRQPPVGSPEEERLLSIYNEFIDGGVAPEQAEALAREQFANEQAEVVEDVGEQRAGETVSPAGGVGAGVAGVPGSVSPTERVGAVEPTGVVSPATDVEQPAGRAGAEPSAVTKTEEELAAAKKDAASFGVASVESAFGNVSSYSDLQDAIDSARENIADTFDERGITDPYVKQSLIEVAQKAFDAEVQRRLGKPAEGTTDVSQTTEAQQAEAQGQEAPAADAGAAATEVTDTGTPDEAQTLTGFAAAVAPRTGEEAPKTKRGRPAIPRTEEEKERQKTQRDIQNRRVSNADYAIKRAKKKLDQAFTPLDEDAFETDEAYESALKDQAALRDDALRDLATVEASPALKNTAVWKRARAALKDSRLDEKDVARIRKSVVERDMATLKARGSETSGAVREPNPGIEKAKTLEQALNAVIKTGTPLQKFFAKRLMSAARGVKFVVVPAEAFDSSPELEGVLGYFDTEDDVVYVRAASGDAPNGVNNVTVLHEAIHAAASARLTFGIGLAAKGVKGALTEATLDIANLMLDAEEAYNELTAYGTKFPSENLLEVGTIVSDSQNEVFSDPHEFLSYALTEPAMERFLTESVPGTSVTEPNGFSRFVQSVMRLLGISTNNNKINNAFGVLIAATDKLLGAPITPRMKAMQLLMSAGYAARGPKAPPKQPTEISSVAKANAIRSAKERSKDVADALKKLRESKASQMYKEVGMLQRMRDENDYLIPFKVLYSKANRATKYTLANAPTFDFLARWMAKDLPPVKDTYAIVQKMLGHINALHASAIDQIKMLDKDFKADKTLEGKVTDLALLSTLAEMNPADPNTVEREPILDRLYEELGERGQKVFNRIIEFHNALRDYQQSLLDKQIEGLPGLTDEVKENLLNRIYQKFAEDRRIEPYLPLIRDSGDFWLAVGTGDNTQVYVYETAEQRDADAARIAREEYNNQPLDQLFEDGEFGRGNELSSLRGRIDIRGTLLSELFDAIDSNVPRDPVSAINAGEINAQIKNDLFDLWLAMLPEQAFRKQFISRKGRAGFRPDLRRNLASHMARVAPSLSRLKYGNDLRAQAARMDLYVKNDPNNLTAIKKSVEERVGKIMSPDKRGIWDAVAGLANKLTYLTYLTGAFTALTQPFGIWLSGLPILTANHNANPATVAKELAKTTAYWKQYGITRRLPDGTITYEAPSLANSKTLTEEERRAVRAMVDLNVATNTFSGFLWDASRDEAEAAAPARTTVGKAKQAVGSGFDLAINAPLRNIERLTREALYLASYRLGRQRGLSEADAIAQAASDVKESLGDYDQASRPAWMQNPFGRVAFAMKMYPVVVIQQLLGSFLNIIKPMNGQTRKQALIKFSGIYMTTAMLAGVYNMPLADLMISLLTSALKDMDDDDLPDELKDKNPVLWFKTVFMPNMFGDTKIFGVPLDRILGEGALTAFTNRAIGSRIGFNDLWARDGKPSANAQDAITAFMIGYFGGPSASYLLSLGKMYEDMMVGDYERAFERSVPLAHVRNIMVTKRAAEKGYDTSRGVIVSPEEVSAADLIWQSLGVTPADVAAARELSFKATGEQQKILNQRNLITRRIKYAFDNGDTARMQDIIQEEVVKFNRNNPTFAITAKNLSDMMEAHVEARAMSRAGTPMSEKNYILFDEAVQNMESRIAERSKK